MYRVIEVARKLSVSKVTIYKKISKNKKTLKNHIHVRSNITYIDDVGLEIIKDAIGENIKSTFENNAQLDALKKDYLIDLNHTIEYLSNQIQMKKKQVENKDKLLKIYKKKFENL